MKFQIRENELRAIRLSTRMPFRYGIATMTAFPLVFLKLTVRCGGQTATGIASDLLPPKWFTKNPDQPVEEEIDEMFEVIRRAATSAAGLEGDSAFDLWWRLYRLQDAWGRDRDAPPLLTHFGTSLVERALIEAVCRCLNTPFFTALKDNLLGVELGRIHPELEGRVPGDFLPPKPLQRVIARHTVGLSDPLETTDIPPDQRLQDGLPHALDECIRTYHLRHFKIKISGDHEHDHARLSALARVIETHASPDFAFSLDGNEQFKSMRAFRAYWDSIGQSASWKAFLDRLLFVEQPLHRDAALLPSVETELVRWPDHPAMIIDESGGALESLPRALGLGYSGTSHKNCKGVFKGLANLCLLRHRRQQQRGGRPYLMSGEDLCNQGPIALLQDLAVMAAFGIESVERNGHHYCAGLSGLPPRVQRQVETAHSDLYHPSPRGWPTLSIQDGALRMTSINRAPFGVHCRIDLGPFEDVTS